MVFVPSAWSLAQIGSMILVKICRGAAGVGGASAAWGSAACCEAELELFAAAAALRLRFSCGPSALTAVPKKVPLKSDVAMPRLSR
eukprot:4828199-Pyramimonas_sp.AAC.1